MTELRKVLCPVDLTPDASHAAEQAAELATSLGAELLLLHVMSEPTMAFAEPLLAPGDATTFALPVLADDYRIEMDNRLTRLGNKLRANGLQVSTLLMRGSPHEAITSAADQQHADLIVMSTHGRTGLSHLLLGSVTERVVRTAKVPVMTLRLN